MGDFSMNLQDDAFSKELLDIIKEKNIDGKNDIRIQINEVVKSFLFPKARVYFCKNVLGTRVFHEELDLMYYLERFADRTSTVYAAEYLGEAFGSKDVIRLVNPDGTFKICALRSEESYSVLNVDVFIRNGSSVWGIEFGSLREECVALRNNGVTFESDIFSEKGELFDRFKEFAEARNGKSESVARYQLTPKKDSDN